MGTFFGTVVSWDSNSSKYEIQYDDGDFTKMTELEVLSSIMETSPLLCDRRATNPLSDVTNRMDDVSEFSKLHYKNNKKVKFENDVETCSSVTPYMRSSVLHTSSLPPVPPPQLSHNLCGVRKKEEEEKKKKVVAPARIKDDAATRKEEEEMMMMERRRRNMTSDDHDDDLAELRPDGVFSSSSRVPVAEVVDEGCDESMMRRRHGHHGRNKKHNKQASEACVCTISGCVVM